MKSSRDGAIRAKFDECGTVYEPVGFDALSTLLCVNFPDFSSKIDVFNYFSWLSPVVFVDDVINEESKNIVTGAFVVVFANDHIAAMINESRTPFPGTSKEDVIIYKKFVTPRPTLVESTWNRLVGFFTGPPQNSKMNDESEVEVKNESPERGFHVSSSSSDSSSESEKNIKKKINDKNVKNKKKDSSSESEKNIKKKVMDRSVKEKNKKNDSSSDSEKNIKKKINDRNVKNKKKSDSSSKKPVKKDSSSDSDSSETE
eukprot:GHVL01039440.1.p1 GENE.GHVL01039440.1~~GHVL01039440.1.p1  ORF type:complete len:258 (+),score=90.97 GHVL01039440.1:50-823(+)